MTETGPREQTEKLLEHAQSQGFKGALYIARERVITYHSDTAGLSFCLSSFIYFLSNRIQCERYSSAEIHAR